MKVTIVGYGFVGQHLADSVRRRAEVTIHDPDKGFVEKNKVDMAFICVPTPMGPNGEANISEVTKAISEVDAELYVIKSTVPPGTSRYLMESTKKRIVFSPEYMGESKYYTPPQFPDPERMDQHGFMIVGGLSRDTEEVIDFFLPIFGPTCRFRQMSHTQAEIVKYAENSFFALKVAFANELREICDAFGAPYHAVREGWMDDPRVGPMHTAAFKDERGFGGKCLPKDIAALAFACRDLGHRSPLLEAVIKANEEHRG